VSRYRKGKTNLDFTEARDGKWQWHQLGHMQVCTVLQTDNDAFTPPLVFYRPDALSAAQPTASKLWRQVLNQDLKGNFFYYIWSEVLTEPPTQSAVELKAQTGPRHFRTQYLFQRLTAPGKVGLLILIPSVVTHCSLPKPVCPAQLYTTAAFVVSFCMSAVFISNAASQHWVTPMTSAQTLRL